MATLPGAAALHPSTSQLTPTNLLLLILPAGKSSKIQTGLYINGKFQPALDGKTFSVVNPSTGKEITQISEASAKDVDAAVKAARQAYETSWGTKVSAASTPRSMYAPLFQCS